MTEQGIEMTQVVTVKWWLEDKCGDWMMSGGGWWGGRCLQWLPHPTPQAVQVWVYNGCHMCPKITLIPGLPPAPPFIHNINPPSRKHKIRSRWERTHRDKPVAFLATKIPVIPSLRPLRVMFSCESSAAEMACCHGVSLDRCGWNV